MWDASEMLANAVARRIIGYCRRKFSGESIWARVKYQPNQERASSGGSGFFRYLARVITQNSGIQAKRQFRQDKQDKNSAQRITSKHVDSVLQSRLHPVRQTAKKNIPKSNPHQSPLVRGEALKSPLIRGDLEGFVLDVEVIKSWFVLRDMAISKLSFL